LNGLECEEMKLKSIPFLILGACFVACSEQRTDQKFPPLGAQPKVRDQMMATGILKYFPSDVKSVQAWSGHTFMVGSTPVIATSEVSEEMLNKLVETEVTVTGEWHPGEKWQASEEDAISQTPHFPTGQDIVRGEGIKLISIKPK
jgi:hypothetical protein